MKFCWDRGYATVVYDLDQEKFFCAANPSHRENYFCKNGRVVKLRKNTGCGEWHPPVSAARAGIYRPDIRAVDYSIIEGEDIVGVRLYYPYILEKEAREVPTIVEHCVAMVKDLEVPDAAVKFCAVPGRLSRAQIFEFSKTDPRQAGFRQQKYRYIDMASGPGSKCYRQVCLAAEGRGGWPTVEDTKSVCFYTDCSGMSTLSKARRLAPYIFTEWRWRPE